MVYEPGIWGICPPAGPWPAGRWAYSAVEVDDRRSRCCRGLLTRWGSLEAKPFGLLCRRGRNVLRRPTSLLACVRGRVIRAVKHPALCFGLLLNLSTSRCKLACFESSGATTNSCVCSKNCDRSVETSINRFTFPIVGSMPLTILTFQFNSPYDRSTKPSSSIERTVLCFPLCDFDWPALKLLAIVLLVKPRSPRSHAKFLLLSTPHNKYGECPSRRFAALVQCFSPA